MNKQRAQSYTQAVTSVVVGLIAAKAKVNVKYKETRNGVHWFVVMLNFSCEYSVDAPEYVLEQFK